MLAMSLVQLLLICGAAHGCMQRALFSPVCDLQWYRLREYNGEDIYY